MSLALFFGVLVLLLVLTVPICVSFAFVTLLPSIVDASFPYTADAAVRSMVSGLNNFPLLAIPLFIIAGVIMAKGQISRRSSPGRLRWPAPRPAPPCPGRR